MNTHATAMQTETGRVIASCFALAAFAVAIFAGLAGGNPAAQILLRAVLAMFICYPLGLMVGLVCDNLIRNHALANSLEGAGDSADDAGESANTNFATTGVPTSSVLRAEPIAMKSRAAA